MRMMDPALLLLRNLQRFQTHAPLPPHRRTSPINTMRPPDTDIDPQRREQLHIDIDAFGIATGALVHNLDVLDRSPVARVVDVDEGAAEGIVVGVQGREEEFGDGDDGLPMCGGDVAGGVCGGEVGGVDGHVAGVG